MARAAVSWLDLAGAEAGASEPVAAVGVLAVVEACCAEDRDGVDGPAGSAWVAVLAGSLACASPREPDSVEALGPEELAFGAATTEGRALVCGLFEGTDGTST
jgi:hypothetical protein